VRHRFQSTFRPARMRRHSRVSLIGARNSHLTNQPGVAKSRDTARRTSGDRAWATNVSTALTRELNFGCSRNALSHGSALSVCGAQTKPRDMGGHCRPPKHFGARVLWSPMAACLADRKPRCSAAAGADQRGSSIGMPAVVTGCLAAQATPPPRCPPSTPPRMPPAESPRAPRASCASCLPSVSPAACACG
jgi:hypothetical protein